MAAAAGAGADAEVDFEFFPIIRRYKSGRVERFMNIPPLPAGTDPATGVTSKDVVVDPAIGLWARLFLPPGAGAGTSQGKLPVVVYYHGGAYVVGSAADPFTHSYLNGLVAEAGVLAVALEYRLAPEHHLPAAYDDSWEGLRWVASHANGGGGAEPWLLDHGDIAARVAADRVLVCVAEKDSLRDRGVWYYESLKASGYAGEVDLLESMGEGHVFYCMDPRCEKAREMQARILSFLRK
uniref:Alpha/beta hydrolase fold-3 domain-containing protein n=1 Tax=Oryza punctata TaxID=4537 RepID=A0A0E0L9A8_ORYPU